MLLCARASGILTALLLAGGAAGETLKLQSGDLLNGEVVESTDEYVLLQHPLLGELRVPRSEVLPAEPPKPEKPGLFGTRFMEGWTREANLGVSGAEGNTVNFNLTGGFDFRAENERRRWTWTGRYILRTESNSTTDNNARVRSRYDWLIPDSRFFLFVEPIYDYDDFKNWQHRATLSAGPGYDIVKREAVDFRTGLGVSGQREFAGEKQTRFSGFWSLDLVWRISDRQTLTAGNQIFPFLVNTPGEYRNLSTLDWKIRLTDSPLLNLHFGVENEYESDAPPEDDKNDLKYFTTLGVVF